MKYSVIDPSVYGIKINPGSHPSDSIDVSDRTGANEDSGATEHASLSAHPSSTTSSALPAVADTSQSAAQFPGATQEGEVTHQPSSSLTTNGTSSSVTAARPQRRVSPSKQQERLEARKQRSAEIRKRKTRENIARKVGHEVDSEGEEEYWRACRDRDIAEQDRRQRLSPDAQKREDIKSASASFRNHIKPQVAVVDSGLVRLYHYPLFLLQAAPDSASGAMCRLPVCTDRIAPGQYRIAVSPGVYDRRSPGKTLSKLNFCRSVPQLENPCASRTLNPRPTCTL